MIRYDFYNNKGNYYGKFLKRNPEFNTKDFQEFVISKNKGDRDAGELEYIAKHEVLRLAHEFIERRWRFPNVYSEDEPIMN